MIKLEGSKWNGSFEVNRKKKKEIEIKLKYFLNAESSG